MLEIFFLFTETSFDIFTFSMEEIHYLKQYRVNVGFCIFYDCIKNKYVLYRVPKNIKTNFIYLCYLSEKSRQCEFHNCSKYGLNQDYVNETMQVLP